MDAFEKARQKRQDLLAQLEKVDAFLALGEELGLGEAADSAAPPRPTPVLVPEATFVRRSRPAPPSGESVVATTVEAAKEALEAAKRPLPTSALLDAVLAKGVEVGGKIPSSTLSARLSNSGVLKNHKGFGWWLADKPLPSVFD
jgi:hypothetical protein